MAIKILRPETKWYGQIIPGGWEVTVPESRLISSDEAAYVAYWVQQGMRTREAKEHVRKVHQTIYTTRFMMLVKQKVGSMLDWYMKNYPELGVRGFDPEICARMYVPGRSNNFTVDVAAREMLHKMAQRGYDERVREIEESERGAGDASLSDMGSVTGG